MKRKLNIFLYNSLQAVIAITLSVAAWGAGFATRNSTEVWDWVCSGCGVALGIAAIFNIAFTVKFMRKFYRRNKVVDVGAVGGWAMDGKQKIEADFKKAEKSINRLIAAAYVYLFFIAALLLLFCFAFGRATPADTSDGVGSITVITVSGFLLWGITAVLIAPTDPPEDNDGSLEITPQSHPEIYGIVSRAATACGCRKKIRVTASDYGISVTEYRGCAVINLESVEAAILTDGELYNVMLHEFAHVLCAHSKKSKRYNRFGDKWNGGNPNPVAFIAKPLFLSFFGLTVGLKANMFEMIVSRKYEEAADEAVRKFGDPQTYANALCKSNLYSNFTAMPRPELDYYYYAPEKPAGNYRIKEYGLFFVYREKYGKLWQEVMERELPQRVPTHPLFRERIAATGCEKYDGCAVTDNENYIAEMRQINEKLDEMTTEKVVPDYEKIRKSAYLDRKAAIESYENSVKSGIPLDDEKLVLAIQALRGVDDGLALKACGEVIARYASDAFAHLVTGAILADAFDPACVEHLQTAAENPDYADSALDRLAVYALKSGNAQLIEEYRDGITARLQKVADHEHRTRFDRRTVLLPSELPEEVISKLREKLAAIGDGVLESAYVCKFNYGDGKTRYPLIVKLKKGKDANEVYDRLCEIVHGLSLKYDSVIWAMTPLMKKKLKKSGCKPLIN